MTHAGVPGPHPDLAAAGQPGASAGGEELARSGRTLVGLLEQAEADARIDRARARSLVLVLRAELAAHRRHIDAVLHEGDGRDAALASWCRSGLAQIAAGLDALERLPAASAEWPVAVAALRWRVLDHLAREEEALAPPSGRAGDSAEDASDGAAPDEPGDWREIDARWHADDTHDVDDIDIAAHVPNRPID